MIGRRDVLTRGGIAAFAVATGNAASIARAFADTATLPFGNGERPLVKVPGKRALIQLTARPPQYETPFSVFNEGVITPNDAFFVRYHLAGIPLEIDPSTYKIAVKGKVGQPLELSLDDLKTGFEPREIVAVNQCSGNSRGFFEPRVAGGQLANGAMGNARWKGVPLESRARQGRRLGGEPSRSRSAASTGRSIRRRPISPSRSISIMRGTAR